jgi:hypothetical protein
VKKSNENLKKIDIRLMNYSNSEQKKNMLMLNENPSTNI